MTILFKAPREVAEVREIPNTLKALQELVGGYIEATPFDGDLRLVVNEEGKLMRLEPNVLAPTFDVLVGPVVVTAYDGKGDFRSLTEAEIYFSKEYLTDCEV